MARTTDHNGTNGAFPKEDFFHSPTVLLKYSSCFSNTAGTGRIFAGYEAGVTLNPLVILYSTNSIRVLPGKKWFERQSIDKVFTPAIATIRSASH